MWRILVIFVISFLCVSCTSNVRVSGFGVQPCIGAFDTRDPRFLYKMSAWNVFIGLLFFELLVPPVIIVANEIFCPISAKETGDK